MTKQIGQTWMPRETNGSIVEITGITKTGRIKFDQYFNGKKVSSWTWTEKEFDRFYPTFVAN